MLYAVRTALASRWDGYAASLHAICSPSRTGPPTRSDGSLASDCVRASLLHRDLHNPSCTRRPPAVGLRLRSRGSVCQLHHRSTDPLHPRAQAATRSDGETSQLALAARDLDFAETPSTVRSPSYARFFAVAPAVRRRSSRSRSRSLGRQLPWLPPSTQPLLDHAPGPPTRSDGARSLSRSWLGRLRSAIT
jgi:hypothetical protein